MIRTRHRSNEYEQNLGFHQIQTSASKKVIITVSDLCLFMWQILDRKQPVVVPAAKTTAEPVKQYFLNMFLTLSLSEVPSSTSLLFSRTLIRSWNSVILSLSLIVCSSFSSWATPWASWIEFCFSSIWLSFWAIEQSKPLALGQVRFWFVF